MTMKKIIGNIGLVATFVINLMVQTRDHYEGDAPLLLQNRIDILPRCLNPHNRAEANQRSTCDVFIGDSNGDVEFSKRVELNCGKIITLWTGSSDKATMPTSLWLSSCSGTVVPAHSSSAVIEVDDNKKFFSRPQLSEAAFFDDTSYTSLIPVGILMLIIFSFWITRQFFITNSTILSTCLIGMARISLEEDLLELVVPTRYYSVAVIENRFIWEAGHKDFLVYSLVLAGMLYAMLVQQQKPKYSVVRDNNEVSVATGEGLNTLLDIRCVGKPSASFSTEETPCSTSSLSTSSTEGSNTYSSYSFIHEDEAASASCAVAVSIVYEESTRTRLSMKVSSSAAQSDSDSNTENSSDVINYRKNSDGVSIFTFGSKMASRGDGSIVYERDIYHVNSSDPDWNSSCSQISKDGLLEMCHNLDFLAHKLKKDCQQKYPGSASLGCSDSAALSSQSPIFRGGIASQVSRSTLIAHACVNDDITTTESSLSTKSFGVVSAAPLSKGTSNAQLEKERRENMISACLFKMKIEQSISDEEERCFVIIEESAMLKRGFVFAFVIVCVSCIIVEYTAQNPHVLRGVLSHRVLADIFPFPSSVATTISY